MYACVYAQQKKNKTIYLAYYFLSYLFKYNAYAVLQ